MDKWIVHKFGGSSVADAACFRRVADIIEASGNPREAAVLSACRGVTDALLDLVKLAGQPDGYFPSALHALERRHAALAAELVGKEACDAYCAQLQGDVRDIGGMLQTARLIRSAPDSVRDVIAGYGEIWSTRLFAASSPSAAGSGAKCAGSMRGGSWWSTGALWDPRCSGQQAKPTCRLWCPRTSPGAWW